MTQPSNERRFRRFLESLPMDRSHQLHALALDVGKLSIETSGRRLFVDVAAE
jgi:hypothetical protein